MVATADVLQALWAATLAASASLLLTMVMPQLLRRRFGASVAYAAWWLVPAALLASQLLVLSGGEAIVVSPSLRPGGIVLPTEAIPTIAKTVPTSDPALSWLVVWGVGMVVMATVLWLQQRGFVRGLGGLQYVRDDLWQAGACDGLPALIGVTSARIVLPSDFYQRYDEIERQLMLTHERMHRQRGDPLANLAVAVFRCVFWFNPLTHLAAGRFRQDQELACDQAVIAAHPHARRTYGEAMLKTLASSAQAPLGCHWQAGYPLKARILHLASPVPRKWAQRCGIAAVAVLSLGAGLSVWSAKVALDLSPFVTADDSVRFDLIAMRDGRAFATSSVRARFGQEVVFELSDDMRIVTTAARPAAEQSDSVAGDRFGPMSNVRARFYARHQGSWLLDQDSSGRMPLRSTPSFQASYDNGVDILLMPRQVTRLQSSFK